jgi:large subunit ribosomal protein L6
MSRKGKIPVKIPSGVQAKMEGSNFNVKGPKGTLSIEIPQEIKLDIKGDEIHVELKDDASDKGNLHGLYRTLIDNLIIGVTKGFERRLEMIGVGYRANVQGPLLDLQLGFSHPVKLSIPKGIDVKVDKNTLITLTGSDKQVVGQFAADIRSMKPPEPYQGKGIRYQGEYVRKKAGKTAAKK